MPNPAVRVADSFITVDGLKTRYLEQGTGVPALLLHGASLGSSADVFQRTIPVFAAAGIRAIAFDFPGFGKSDQPPDLGQGFRTAFVLKFADALGLDKLAIVAHSQAAGPATTIALENPERITHLFFSDGADLLPPLESGGQMIGSRDEEVLARIQDRMARNVPSIEDIRLQLGAFLSNHDLITDDELALRYESCTGQVYKNFVERRAAAQAAGMHHAAVPNWQRLNELKMPIILMFGRQDRGRCEERTKLLIERYPNLEIHLVDQAKHMTHWDQAEMYQRLAIPFLTSPVPARS